MAAFVLAGLALAGCTAGDGGSASPGPSSSAGPGRTITTAAASSAAPQPSWGRPTVARQPGRFTVAFAGDVHFTGRVAARLARDPATVFGAAQPGLASAGLTMVNLETAITTGGTPQAKAFTFRAPPSALPALRASGVDVATMANNHGADFGATGLRDTLRAIRTSRFPVIGIGRDADEAFRPFRALVAGTKLAIFAADQVDDETTLRLFSAGAGKPGVADAYQPRLVREVRRAARAGWTVIVYLHWGVEYESCPSHLQRGLADRLAAAGAAAVVGTHAHVLQGAGWRPDGTYVAYGLGNYLWWQSFGNEQDDNGVLTLTFKDDRVVGSRFAASHLDDRGVPLPATGGTKRRIDTEWARDRACAGLSARPPG